MQKFPTYFTQLDGLRAIAISLVILFHWFPEGQGVNSIANGPLGVTLFFVLSGFLITRILLISRQKIPTEGIGKVYSEFMIRRMLRIFPIYYLVLLIVWIAQFNSFVPKINTDFYQRPLYYLLYLYNFLLENTGNWSDILSPFWSLAVEEQFYIFWPFLILTVKEKYLKMVVIFAIVLGVSFRFLLFSFGYKMGILMPDCIDTFAIGALWALVSFDEKYSKTALKYINITALPALLLFVVYSIYAINEIYNVIFFRIIMSVFCLFFVANASVDGGFKNPLAKVLDNTVLRFIGKISYGLYILHMLVPAFVLPTFIRVINRLFDVDFHLSDSLHKIVSLIILITLATISWYFFEMPFIRLKQRLTRYAAS